MHIRVKIQDEKVCGKKAVTVNEKIRKTNRQNKSQKVDFQKAFLSHTCAVYFGGEVRIRKSVQSVCLFWR